MKRQGYLNAKIEKWIIKDTKQGYALDIKIPIKASKRSYVTNIIFRGKYSLNKNRLLKACELKVGKPFDEPNLSSDADKLTRFFNNNGFPYAKVRVSWHYGSDKKSIIVIFDIDEGHKVRIGHMLIVGDVLTSQKAIKKAMSIHEGDPFSYKKIIDSQLNIRRLGPFMYVNITPIGLENKSNIVNLKIKVEEQRPFLIDFGVNYASDEYITGTFTFSNINAFGWAKTNSLKLTAGKNLNRAELSWYDPRFLSSSIEMNANTWVQHKKRPSYSFIQVGGALSWFRRFRKLGFLAKWELDRNYFISGDSVAADADSLRNNTISQTSLSGSFDSRDNFSDPMRGFFTLGSVDVFNEIRGNNANYLKFSWQGEANVSPIKRMTFNTTLRFARIEKVGSGVSVPTSDLLFLGGNDTIRGFGEDSLGPLDSSGKATGATTRWIANEELRLRLSRHIQIAGFYDIGSLTNNFSEISYDTIRHSAGFGIRYITPVGPIRLDYGFKLDRKAGESKGRLHFTFGYVF